jgi:hypothetical protein
MKHKRGLLLVLPVVLAGLGLAVLPYCGGMNLDLDGSGEGNASGSGSGGGMGLGDIANAAANCPNLASVSAISRVNFAKEFGVDARAAGRLEAALKASVELKNLSRSVEADLKGACGRLARDLGANPGNNARSACNAAANAIKQLKAKAGGKFKLSIQPPRCAASMDVMGKCAADCDANIKPGKVDVKCEGGKLSGKCDANCSGSCEMNAGASCNGTCEGTCTAGFSGRCDGECEGKCDGSSTRGKASCAGKCEGKCHAGAHGSCTGSCKGECKIKGSARCSGTCTGGCSVKMKAPHCTGEAKPPKMSAECEAECNAKVSAKLKCVPARVAVTFDGAKNMAAAGKLKAALQAHLPAILKVSIGMKNKLVKASRQIKTVVNGVKGSVKAMTSGSANQAARLTTCVANPFKGAFDAATSLQANVKVSVNVQASAKASAGTN